MRGASRQDKAQLRRCGRWYIALLQKGPFLRASTVEQSKGAVLTGGGTEGDAEIDVQGSRTRQGLNAARMAADTMGNEATNQYQIIMVLSQPWPHGQEGRQGLGGNPLIVSAVGIELHRGFLQKVSDLQSASAAVIHRSVSPFILR